MRARLALVATFGVLGGGCPRKAEPPPVPPGDARVVAEPPHEAAAPKPWPELEEPALAGRIAPVRVIELPARPDVPRFELAGPVIVGDVAVVASSQLGFAAIDWQRGAIVWTKPAGEHVAPPLARGDGASVVLIGECVSPPVVPDGEHLLGCLRVVTRAGADEAYVAIHGKDKRVAAFAGEAGAQNVWPDGDRAVRWRRGEQAVTIDLLSGAATPASAAPPPLVVQYKDKRWDITQVDGRLVASDKGKQLWATKDSFTALLGAVWLPGQSPMVRVARLTTFERQPELLVHDIDATGSLHAQTAKPAPAIQLLGFAVSSVGDAAIALRLDNSLRRDYIAGYAANALLMWVWPLPDLPRADPVGVAIAPDAVVVFHDGDTFTVLPELSAPPTAPGAARAASQNPTP